MSDAINTKPLPSPPEALPKVRPQPNRNFKDKEADDVEEDDDFEFFHEFKRENVKGIIHLITAEIKQKGLDTEYLMIPFRPEQTNEKLLKLLNQLFPQGNGKPVHESHQKKIVSKYDEFTLFQALKYIWCRLPNAEIVGWKSYLEFKYREEDLKFPQKAFLELMPQCLASPNHASIVYDFFDLIVTLASNSRVNKMSARKISKMCAIWAFNGPPATASTTDSQIPDFGSTKNRPNNSLQDGLDEWIPGSDAMFHLLLAFLKSFVPEDLESSKLPKSLKSLLFNNEYPPAESTAYSSETILTIPLVTLKTDKFSRKPWQLLERCNELLDFQDHDAFEAREDYALLKSLFRKKNNVEGISRKMSQESRRLMKLMSTKHSTFQAGWATRKCLENVYDLKESIEVKRVDIDDYFIWAWLSTLSYEQTSQKKKIFGRPLILEFEFDGFKKWVVFQEIDITLDYQINGDKKKKLPQNVPDSNEKKLKKEPSLQKPTVDPTQPGSRNITPMYQKFQSEVSQDSISTGESTGIYHTVITKDALQKNSNKHNVNLHSIEQKFSKWNPLNNLRKKSNSSSGSSSLDMRDTSITTEKSLPTQPDRYVRKEEKRPTTEYSILSSTNYQLPDIERDEEGFKIDLPSIIVDEREEPNNAYTSSVINPPPLIATETSSPSVTSSSLSKKSRTPVNSTETTIEELNGMVEQMMLAEQLSTEQLADSQSPVLEPERATESTEAETFESLTKFDQYKPSKINDTTQNMEASQSSSVYSSRVPTIPTVTQKTEFVSNLPLQSNTQPTYPKVKPMPKQVPVTNRHSTGYDNYTPTALPINSNLNNIPPQNASNRNYDNTNQQYAYDVTAQPPQPYRQEVRTRAESSPMRGPRTTSPMRGPQVPQPMPQPPYAQNTGTLPPQPYPPPVAAGPPQPYGPIPTSKSTSFSQQQYPPDGYSQVPPVPQPTLPSEQSTQRQYGRPQTYPQVQMPTSPMRSPNPRAPMQPGPYNAAPRGRSQLPTQPPSVYSGYVHQASPTRYGAGAYVSPPMSNQMSPQQQPMPLGQMPVQGYYYNNHGQEISQQGGHGHARAGYGRGKQELYGIPVQTNAGNKLHSGNVKKKQDRRNLYDNIRNGDFGI